MPSDADDNNGGVDGPGAAVKTVMTATSTATMPAKAPTPVQCGLAKNCVMRLPLVSSGCPLSLRSSATDDDSVSARASFQARAIGLVLGIMRSLDQRGQVLQSPIRDAADKSALYWLERGRTLPNLLGGQITGQQFWGESSATTAARPARLRAPDVPTASRAELPCGTAST
jgi:hypothetical protein